jgi:ATP-dependent protease Clp ATPase subunit
VGKKIPDLKKYICSFCGKDNYSVDKLITNGQNINICNECIELCVDILNGEAKPIKIKLDENGKEQG